MKKIFLIAALAFGSFVAQAQTGLVVNTLNGGNPWSIPSYLPDTIVKSTTNFWSAPANTASDGTMQAVSYTFSVDSVGGSPACTLSLWASNDNQHWAPVGTHVVITTANTWYITSTVPGVSDTTVTVNTNPWTAAYIGFKVVWTSATQRGIYHIKVKGFKTY